MKSLLVSVVVTLTIASLAVLTLGMLCFRFNLITIRPPFWYLLAGIILFLVGSWVAANEAPVGRWFATGGIILLALGLYRAAWPQSAEAVNEAQRAADAKIAATVKAVASPKPAATPTPTPIKTPKLEPSPAPEPKSIPIPPEFLSE